MENNFTRKLFGGNIVRAFICCISQHLIFLLNFTLLTHLNLLTPLKVLDEVYDNVTSLKFLLATVAVLLTVSIFTLINSPTFIQSQKFNSRFQYYMNFASATKLAILLQYGLSGVFLANAYASFGGEEFENFFVVCGKSAQDNLCINERKVFFVLLGGWTSLVLFFRDNMLYNKIMAFPIINELTIFKIKKSMVQTVLLNIKTGCLVLLSFTLVYYSIQEHLIHFLQTYLFLSVEKTNLNNFLRMGQLISLLIYCTYIIASHELSKLIFHIFFTRHVEFPIIKCETTSLKEALEITTVPFVQHLAFYDLLILSEGDKDRRSSLFSLSLPGGHPHLWKGIFSPVIGMIESFSEELNKLLSDVGSPSRSKEMKQEVKLLPTGLQIPISSPIRRNLDQGRSFVTPKSPIMRDLSIIYTDKEPTKESAPATNTVSEVTIFYACLKAFNELYSHLKEQIQDPAILNYFLVSNTDYKLFCILQNIQLVSWSVDSLSLLACASFTEDKYGIVQQDLMRIIVAILRVKNVIEKLPKNSALHRVFLFYDKHARSNLKATVKRSLYRMALTFGDYIYTLSLPLDAEQQMSQFLNFVES